MPVINTNLAANSALRYTNINTNNQNSFLRQLSSGLRVNRAGDDPAALSIGSRIKGDGVALRQAAINAQTVTAALNTAEGGLQQILAVLQKMKGIISNARSGVPDASTLANLNTSFIALRGEIDSIAGQTQFAGQALIDGTGAANTFSNTAGAVVLLGIASGDTLTISLSAAGAGNNATATGLAVNASVVDTTANATTAQGAVDAALNTVIRFLATVGGFQQRVAARADNINVLVENADASVSATMEADVAKAQTDYTNADVLTQSGIAALQKANSQKLALLRLLQS